MDMHARVRVLDRMLRSETGLKYRLQVGDHEFQAVAVRMAVGGWQLSLLPAEPNSHPVVRLRVEELPSNDVELTIDDLEATLLALFGSMADRLRQHADPGGP